MDLKRMTGILFLVNNYWFFSNHFWLDESTLSLIRIITVIIMYVQSTSVCAFNFDDFKFIRWFFHFLIPEGCCFHKVEYCSIVVLFLRLKFRLLCVFILLVQQLVPWPFCYWCYGAPNTRMGLEEYSISLHYYCQNL